MNLHFGIFIKKLVVVCLVMSQGGAFCMEMRESSIDVDASLVSFAQKHLASHLISIEVREGLLERKSVLVVLSETIMSDFDTWKTQSLEVRGVTEACFLLRSLFENIPELKSEKLHMTVYRKRDVRRLYVHRGETDSCQELELNSGDVLVFNQVSF